MRPSCTGRYKRFRTAVAFHVLTVLFFLIFDYLYFLVSQL